MGRHRLTITVSPELYDALHEVAGPRRFSHWLEQAAWERMERLADRDLVGVGRLVDTAEDRADLGATTAPGEDDEQPAASAPRWSALRGTGR